MGRGLTSERPIDPVQRIQELLSKTAGPAGADLAVAASAALAGGLAALELYERDDLAVEDPTGGGPVTAADQASQEAILEVLGRQRRDEPILSEEAPAPAGLAEARLWVVDPLDGTREFIDRIGEFSVMVGLAVEGAAELGAVYQPATDRLFAGAAGVGAWRIEDASARPRTERLATRPVHEPLRFVRSRSHPDDRIRRLEAALGEVEVILSGSAGSKCALVASGEADLYVHPVPYLKEWDTCAPEAMLRAAGGRVTDCRGEPLRYGKDHPAQPGGIFAAHPAAWESALPIVREIANDNRVE
ncbi:MAG TPA: 3'(2'),5'-bisphosphate nucleotidase CysQ [Gemmatimonadota bacterium]|nr:3'(2'),5'-bisphosphate nucleotidase CysQ [Gemmatimonadota bacterium]